MILLIPFVLVMIDARTEAAMGKFPYDRAVIAKAVHRAAELGARGVVLKFFFPAPGSPAGDAALAAEMSKTKVLLQSSRAVPPTLTLFARNAHAIGNVDVDDLSWVPVQGSLYTAAVELATGKPLKIPEQTVPVKFPARDEAAYTSLVDFLNSKSPPDVKGKVVIIGLDTAAAPRLQTPIGSLGVHRVFYYQLISFYDSVTRQAQSVKNR